MCRYMRFLSPIKSAFCLVILTQVLLLSELFLKPPLLSAQPYNLLEEPMRLNRLGWMRLEPLLETKGILLYSEEDIQLEPMLIAKRTVADTMRYGALELEVFTVRKYLDDRIKKKTHEMGVHLVKSSL